MALSHVQAFNLDDPQQLEEKGIEAGTLFGNIGEIIEISDRFLEIMMLGFIGGGFIVDNLRSPRSTTGSLRVFNNKFLKKGLLTGNWCVW